MQRNRPESLLEHQLIKLFDEQIRQMQNRSDKQLRPIPPFFWDMSGRAAIHGTMTTAQKFLGETIFIDMVTQPQQCLEIMNWMERIFQSLTAVRSLLQASYIERLISLSIKPGLKFILPRS